MEREGHSVTNVFKKLYGVVFKCPLAEDANAVSSHQRIPLEYHCQDVLCHTRGIIKNKRHVKRHVQAIHPIQWDMFKRGECEREVDLTAEEASARARETLNRATDGQQPTTDQAPTPAPATALNPDHQPLPLHATATELITESRPSPDAEQGDQRATPQADDEMQVCMPD